MDIDYSLFGCARSYFLRARLIIARFLGDAHTLDPERPGGYPVKKCLPLEGYDPRGMFGGGNGPREYFFLGSR